MIKLDAVYNRAVTGIQNILKDPTQRLPASGAAALVGLAAGGFWAGLGFLAAAYAYGESLQGRAPVVKVVQQLAAAPTVPEVILVRRKALTDEIAALREANGQVTRERNDLQNKVGEMKPHLMQAAADVGAAMAKIRVLSKQVQQLDSLREQRSELKTEVTQLREQLQAQDCEHLIQRARIEELTDELTEASAQSIQSHRQMEEVALKEEVFAKQALQIKRLISVVLEVRTTNTQLREEIAALTQLRALSAPAPDAPPGPPVSASAIPASAPVPADVPPAPPVSASAIPAAPVPSAEPAPVPEAPPGPPASASAAPVAPPAPPATPPTPTLLASIRAGTRLKKPGERSPRPPNMMQQLAAAIQARRPHINPEKR
jgi:hypothetical protein